MPITKRHNSLQNLHKVDVLFEEEGLHSNFFNITEFPDPLQVGKNSFLIDGSPKLANFTELKIDIVDSAGISVYHEPVRGYLEGMMRRISVEVYNHNAPGSGFLYIVGEANPEVVDVPVEWRGIYNVRYVRPISINTTQINTQPIFFYKQPKIRGREITKAFIEELPPSASYTITGSVTVTATTAGSEIIGSTTVNDDEDHNPYVTTTGENAAGAVLKTYKNKRENKISVINQPIVLSLGTIQRRASPERPSHTITIQGMESSPENEQDKLTSAFVGGKVLIRNPVLDESSFYIGTNQYIKVNNNETTYATRIQEVLDSKTFIPEKPFFVSVHDQKQDDDKPGYDDPDFDSARVWSTTLPDGKVIGSSIEPNEVDPIQPDTPHIDETGAKYYWGAVTSPTRIPNEGAAGGNETIKYYGWNESGSIDQSSQEGVTARYNVSMLPNTNVTMSIFPTPGKKLMDTYLRSYVDFSIVNMRTFSGDVFRVKVYGKLRGGLSDYEVLYDSPTESPQVLMDPFSVDGFTNVGYFYSGSIIDNYWASSSNSTVLQNDDYMVDGALMSGSNYNLNEQVEFFTTASYQLERNVEYAVGFDSYYIKKPKKFTIKTGGSETTKEEDSAELKVYLSGSRAKDGTGDMNEDVYLGKVKIPPGPSTAEGEQKGVFQTFLSSRKHFPSAQLKFVVTSGQWVIKDVELKPSSDTNFSPDYFRTIVPLPYIHKRPAMMDFLVEFYDVDNKIADSFAFFEKFRIIGSPQVIAQGDKNLLSGSMYLGNTQGSGIEMHGGSAYMRSVGYEGFEATISSGSGGFMIWSGSLDDGTRTDGSGLLHTTESYSGVGLEIVDAHGATDRYMRFRTNPSIFEVVTDTFFLGGTAQFVSGSNQKIEISSSNFHLHPDGDVVMQGTITAEAGGTIGGFTIGSTDLTATNFTIDTDDKSISLGSGNTIFIADADEGIQLGHATFGSAPFSVTPAGVLKAESGTVAGFTIATSGITSTGIGVHPTGQTYAFTAGSSNEFNVKHSGQITGSNVLFTGGVIAGATISDTEIKYGSNWAISASSTADEYFISSSKFNVKQSGVVTASEGIIGGWKMQPSPEELRSPNERLVLSARTSHEKITVKDSSGDDVLKIGEISSDTSDQYGIKIFDGTGTSDDNTGAGTVVMLGDLGNKIGGWEITDTQIRSIPDSGFGGQYNLAGGEDGLILSNVGRIHSAAYVPNQKGWNIDTVTNGFAEFQNVVVRGTLKTAVFQKDSVNVVGGTLRIANAAKLTALRSGSTVLSGSVSMSATDVTMSVDNVSGFEAGEILLAKKIGNTGFQTEYLYVTGSQRWSDIDPNVTGSTISSDQDGISGELYVGRAYGQLTGADVSGSSTITLTDGTFTSTTVVNNYSQSIFNVDDASDIAVQNYLKIEHPSSGNFEFVKVTAKNSNTLTVRRKAWFPLDTNLGATEVIGGWPNNSKLWLVNDRMFTAQLHNVVSVGQSYEEGQVFASTGKFTEWISSGWIDLDANPTSPYTPMIQIMERTGSGVYDYVLRTQLGDLSGLSSAYLYGDENPGFGIYTENGYFSGAITAQTGSFAGIVHVATVQGGLETGQKISIGRNVSGTNDGIYINNNNYWYTSAEFHLGDTSNYLWISGSEANPASSFRIKTQDISIDTSTFMLSSSLNNGTLRMGASKGPSSVSANTAGIYMDGAGDFQIYGDSDNYIRFDISDSLDIKTETFKLNTAKLDIDSSAGGSGSIALGATPPTQFNSGHGFFVDGTGKFLAGNTSGDHLKYDGSTLSLVGTMTIGASSTTAVDFGAGAAASASAAETTALTNLNASSSALQGNITTTSASAASAETDAATAQAAIDAMETQLVLDSSGMTISSSGLSPDIGIAQFGTTTTFWDGVQDEDTNRKLELNASGITLWGGAEAGNDYMNLAAGDAGGLSMYSNNVRTLNITDHGINIGKSATGPSSDGATSAVINNISLHSAGAHIYGPDTGDYVNIKSDGVDVWTADTKVAAFGATTTIGDTSYENISITNSTMQFKDSTTVHGSMAAGKWVLGAESNDTTRLELESGQVSFIHRENNNDTSSLVMKADGTIEGTDYIIEKTRLFGSGGFGSITLNGTTATGTFGPNGLQGNVNSNHVYNTPAGGGTTNIDRAIHYLSSKKWFMLQDCYFNDLTISGQAILYPNGHRLYVSGTLTVGTGAGANVGYIYRLGNGGSNGALKVGGAAGATTTVYDPSLSGVTIDGVLRGGGAGGAGGTGAEGGTMDGGGGGGGGSGGGIIFIAARKIINTYGTINVNGGNGGNGADGVGE